MKPNVSELAFEYLRRNKEDLTPEEFFNEYISLMMTFKSVIESHEKNKLTAFDVLF
ncbi:hypothetical protein ACRGNN_000647 [Providencia stuartii]|uniref:hypothetical protein n=1 Tax=Providencia stuartii TaxID=588 RepID=UPI0018C7E0C4|nr:hypothetical protein [Providencia stuartii]EMD1716160.1 hypothetical protein [Providencia stuartii]MBG5906876.1 hypothetical protein [Providencia stuartii]HEM6896113.1 hypothetical protein [Providencia stuartii]